MTFLSQNRDIITRYIIVHVPWRQLTIKVSPHVLTAGKSVLQHSMVCSLVLLFCGFQNLFLCRRVAARRVHLRTHAGFGMGCENETWHCKINHWRMCVRQENTPILRVSTLCGLAKLHACDGLRCATFVTLVHMCITALCDCANLREIGLVEK